MAPRFWKHWLAFALVVAGSFAVLGYYGREIYRQAPPYPGRVISDDGRTLCTREQIQTGQAVWQSIGGQQLGSVWGHGSYVAPDWSADWLHREILYVAQRWSLAAYGKSFAELSPAERAQIQQRLREEYRTNRYDPQSDTLRVSADRAAAIEAMGRYYAAIFGDAETFDADLQFLADGGKTPAELRDAYAMPPRTIRDPQRQGALNSFFFWAAWACATERPAVQRASSGGLPEVLSGQPVTYTNNWPAEPLIDNRPSGAIVLWSVLSFVALLAGVGALAWYYAVLRSDETVIDDLPDTDPLLGLRPTPSMLATRKYFWVVAALVVVQVGLGAVTAHYGVEGQGFYGVPLADPIRVMEWEHEQAAAALRQMRDLTDDFTAPNWACDTLRALLEALAQLEHDLHQHVHKENNVLFPKVLGVPG